jgi:hypothetical protein
MSDDEITITETTVAKISGYRVGVGNVWERQLKDDQGVTALRMSASMAIFDPDSGQEYERKVFAGNTVSLGTDRYLVVKVHEGASGLGSITLRKITP